LLHCRTHRWRDEIRNRIDRDVDLFDDQPNKSHKKIKSFATRSIRTSERFFVSGTQHRTRSERSLLFRFVINNRNNVRTTNEGTWFRLATARAFQRRVQVAATVAQIATLSRPSLAIQITYREGKTQKKKKKKKKTKNEEETVLFRIYLIVARDKAAICFADEIETRRTRRRLFRTRYVAFLKNNQRYAPNTIDTSAMHRPPRRNVSLFQPLSHL
jgi:hypothetical protein